MAAQPETLSAERTPLPEADEGVESEALPGQAPEAETPSERVESPTVPPEEQVPQPLVSQDLEDVRPTRTTRLGWRAAEIVLGLALVGSAIVTFWLRRRG